MSKVAVSCDLKTCMMCRNCLSEWLPAIAAHKQNISLKKGQTVFKEGDPVTGIYFLFSGKAKVHKRWDSEKELIIRFAQSGDILGQMALAGDAIYPVSATMLEAGVVCFVPLDFFQSTLKVNADLTHKLLMRVAKELQNSEKRMRNLAHMSVKGRLAQAFLGLKQQFGADDNGRLNIELTRQDLSAYTGATYESLFRVINELVQEQMITADAKLIRIINEEGLRKLSAEQG